MNENDIVHQLAKAGVQLAVLVQDLTEVEGLSDSYKQSVHRLVCSIEDLERMLYYEVKKKEE